MTAFTPTGIAYDDRGDADVAFLFLPGWCGPRTLFDPLADLLSPDHRTLALDWRGHGESKPASSDFGTAELVDDALSVIEDSNARAVVPVAAAHAGWVAIELRRRLGPERVPRLVFLDWMVLGAPPPFLGALAGMADPASTRAVVDQITEMWLAHLELPALSAYVASMSDTADEMWARAARSITAAFETFGAPLDVVAGLDSPPPTLHLYAQPPEAAYLDAQRDYASANGWFQVDHLDAASHFPIFEVPDTIAENLKQFVAPALI